LADARAAAAALDDQQAVDAFADVQARMRALHAEEAVLATDIARRVEALGMRVSGAADQLAVLAVISPRSADTLLDFCGQVVDRPRVWAALADGLIDKAKARLILDLLDGVDDPQRDALEGKALSYATTHTAHRLRRFLLELVCAEDPDGALRDKAVAARGVWIDLRAHGMADVHAHLSAEHAEVFYQTLTALAGRDDCPDPHEQGDGRTAVQRRADALVGLLDTKARVEVHVDVAISADALIGDNPGQSELGRLGPVSSALARQLAWSPDARWRRLVTDPLTGCLIDASSDTYRIPAPIKRGVRLRDRTCRFPGCTRRAEYTDTDHIIPWPRGRTATRELQALCRRHHLIKTHSAWTAVHTPHSPSHDIRWTSPLGTRRTTRAHNYHPRP
jgi:hypothetical protein